MKPHITRCHSVKSRQYEISVSSNSGERFQLFFEETYCEKSINSFSALFTCGRTGIHFSVGLGKDLWITLFQVCYLSIVRLILCIWNLISYPNYSCCKDELRWASGEIVQEIKFKAKI